MNASTILTEQRPETWGPALVRKPASGLTVSALPKTNPETRVRDSVAAELTRWRTQQRFYHERIAQYLRFIIPEGESVLVLGCEDGALLETLKPTRGMGIDSSQAMINLARERHPNHQYKAASDFTPEGGEAFSYVVVNDITGDVGDVFNFFKAVAGCCDGSTRIVLLQHNYLWRPILRVAAWLGRKRSEGRQNWLSANDLDVFLAGTGFELVARHAKLFCPMRLFGLGTVINAVGGLLPFVSRFASTDILVARLAGHEDRWAKKTASIVLTTRDERENIEPMVRAIPDVGSETEIIFVEGHSVDGTREEIERVIAAYPDRNIRLLGQAGIGQGDAIRTGFAAATGDVIILLEADQTSPAADVKKAFEIVASRRAEFVNGTRFVYPRDKGAMPLGKALGNTLFAIWFTWFLGQRTTDVLCGIKAIDRRQFRRLLKNWGSLGLFDPFGDFELLFGAARLGMKISEVPTRYACRQYGAPKSQLVKHGSMLSRMALRAALVFKCR